MDHRIDIRDTKSLADFRVHIESGIALDKTVKISPRVNIWLDAIIGKNVSIERNVDIGEGSIIGNNVTIGEFSKIGRGATIGNNLIIDSRSIIDDRVILRDNFRTQGSKHLITYLGNDKIKIGCVITTFDWFFENYDHLGIEYGYNKSERDEYFDLIKKVQMSLTHKG